MNTIKIPVAYSADYADFHNNTLTSYLPCDLYICEEPPPPSSPQLKDFLFSRYACLRCVLQSHTWYWTLDSAIHFGSANSLLYSSCVNSDMIVRFGKLLHTTDHHKKWKQYVWAKIWNISQSVSVMDFWKRSASQHWLISVTHQNELSSFQRLVTRHRSSLCKMLRLDNTTEAEITPLEAAGQNGIVQQL